jgi:hypothetical protein
VDDLLDKKKIGPILDRNDQRVAEVGGCFRQTGRYIASRRPRPLPFHQTCVRIAGVDGRVQEDCL